MKQIIPELYVSDCKAALEYYKSIFGGEVRDLQLSDGKEMFKGLQGKVIHSELHINDGCILFLVDILDDRNVGSTDLVLMMENKEETERIYNALAKDGEVRFALQKTFWGATHGVVKDKFGVTWAINLG